MQVSFVPIPSIVIFLWPCFFESDKELSSSAPGRNDVTEYKIEKVISSTSEFQKPRTPRKHK